MWKTPYRYPAKCYTPTDSVLTDIFTSFCPLPLLATHGGLSLELCAVLYHKARHDILTPVRK